MSIKTQYQYNVHLLFEAIKWYILSNSGKCMCIFMHFIYIQTCVNFSTQLLYLWKETSKNLIVDILIYQ